MMRKADGHARGFHPSAIVRWAMAVGATVALAGCAPADPAENVTGGPFPIVTRQIYQADAPTALMTFQSTSAGDQHGAIVGIIHGWPFPHADPDGDFGEGLFSYRIDFVVTDRAADAARTALEARGTRTVYFNAERTPVALHASAASAGKPVITDSVDLWFEFDAHAANVRIKVTMRQTGASPFDWKGERIVPPSSPNRIIEDSGYYSKSANGYLLSPSS